METNKEVVPNQDAEKQQEEEKQKEIKASTN